MDWVVPADLAETEEWPIISLMAELEPEQAERVHAVASQLRRHLRDERRRAALQAAYDELLAGMNIQPAAREIAAALAGDRTVLGDTDEARRAVALRPAIRKRVADLVAPFALPQISYHRVKQIIGKK
jgi:hypothetical protein